MSKALQFLEAAQLELKSHRPDAAATCAVMAGVHANDAICVARLGRFSHAKQHSEALVLAREAGADGRASATHLERLLAVKNKAQYDVTPTTTAAATKAVTTARRMVELAQRVVAG